MADVNEMREALERLADACDVVGVKYFDTDTMSEEVQVMQAATRDARKALAEQPAQGEPTCPHCKTVMRPVHFVGYYDEFHFWSCDCEILPNAVKERGGYA